MTPDPVSDAIRRRATTKLRVDPDHALPEPCPSMYETIGELMELGCMAPHHFPCDPSHQVPPLDSPAPWRFYPLGAAACRELMAYVLTLDGRVDKVAGMLAAADGLILVTWLPDPPMAPLPPDVPFEATRRNMEHVAGVSAAIQNMLLGATSRGIRSYWSSGGVLRGPEVFGRLEIPLDQILLGAVFLFPEPEGRGEVKEGARRGTQGPPESWMRWAEGDSPAV
ncbi:MAG: hypothetical protein OEO23_13895 [Gemmatimonadota bacterium]|nr:hypothetical protein [Gemmatimonadota bacterium]